MKESRRKMVPAVKIVATLSFAIILAFFGYLLFISLLVNPWLETNERELSVINFYSHKNISEDPDIYFIGTSQFKEGIDCYIIEEDLKKANISFNCYNLAVNADSPLRRLTELDSIIRSSPEIVVIGTEIKEIYQSAEIPNSRLILVANKVFLDNASLRFFNDKQRELLTLHPVKRAIENRIYVVSYLNYITLNKISPNSVADYEYRNNFKNPFQNIQNLSVQQKIEKIKNNVQENDTYSEFYGDSLNKLVFKHEIRELLNNNITVIIIDMPQDPLLPKYPSETTRNNYLSFINDTGAPYFDFDNAYPSTYFHDVMHMNILGRTAFSHDAARIIIREVEQ